MRIWWLESFLIVQDYDKINKKIKRTKSQVQKAEILTQEDVLIFSFWFFDCLMENGKVFGCDKSLGRPMNWLRIRPMYVAYGNFLIWLLAIDKLDWISKFSIKFMVNKFQQFHLFINQAFNKRQK